MKLFLASAMFLAAFTTQAARVQFDFDVLSSGASIYPCNAGLKHKPNRGQICYNPETFESCNPGDRDGRPPRGGHDLVANLLGAEETGGRPPRGGGECDPQTGQNCDCVCTGDMNGDFDETLDVMKASYTVWRDHGDPTYGLERNLEVKAGSHDFNELEDEYYTGNKFAARLKELSFNLGSEKYGSKYFVDICFRATQIDYLTETKNDSFDINVDEIVKYAQEQEEVQALTPKYKVERKVTVTDLAGTPNYDLDWDLDNGPIVWSTQSYQSLADLEVTTFLYCKDKDDNAIFIPGPSASLANNSTVNFPTISGYADLRGCVVRYLFSEKSGESNDIDSVRRWKMHGANICTDTAITSFSRRRGHHGH